MLAHNKRNTALLESIRALHMAAYAGPHPVDKCAVDLFYAIGDLLEGRTPENLELRVINRAAFLAELRR